MPGPFIYLRTNWTLHMGISQNRVSLTKPQMVVSEIRGTLLGSILQANPTIWGLKGVPYFRKPPNEAESPFISGST